MAPFYSIHVKQPKRISTALKDGAKIPGALSWQVIFTNMGLSQGKYTFFSLLNWTPVIAVGYTASIVIRFLLNG